MQTKQKAGFPFFVKLQNDTGHNAVFAPLYYPVNRLALNLFYKDVRMRLFFDLLLGF